MSKTGSVHNGSVEEAEKGSITVTTITDLGDKDEALKLVGLERVEVVSEERYRKVRRKLVRHCSKRIHV